MHGKPPGSHVGSIQISAIRQYMAHLDAASEYTDCPHCGAQWPSWRWAVSGDYLAMEEKGRMWLSSPEKGAGRCVTFCKPTCKKQRFCPPLTEAQSEAQRKQDLETLFQLWGKQPRSPPAAATAEQRANDDEERPAQPRREQSEAAAVPQQLSIAKRKAKWVREFWQARKVKPYILHLDQLDGEIERKAFVRDFKRATRGFIESLMPASWGEDAENAEAAAAPVSAEDADREPQCHHQKRRRLSTN